MQTSDYYQQRNRIVSSHASYSKNLMTRKEYHAIVEDYDKYQAVREANAIPSRVNRTGTYYKYLLKEIERKYNVKL